jgi:hypothetical protein
MANRSALVGFSHRIALRRGEIVVGDGYGYLSPTTLLSEYFSYWSNVRTGRPLFVSLPDGRALSGAAMLWDGCGNGLEGGRA